MSTPNPPGPQPTPDQIALQAKTIRYINLGCSLFIFGPFLLFGLVAILQVSLGWDSLDQVDRIGGLVMGCLFTAVGGVPFLAAQFKHDWIVQKLLLQKKHPGQPWMWREEWRTGVLSDVGSSGVIWHWVGAAGVTIALAILAFQGDEAPAYAYLAQSYPTLTKVCIALVLVIPASLIGRAIHATLRARKFAGSKFIMSTIPCRLGGKLTGKVETTMQEIPKDGVWLTLRCVHVSRRAPTNRGTRRESTKVIWYTKQTVGVPGLERGLTGVRVPVEFEIPPDGEPTGRVRTFVHCEWQLVVTAILPGVDYRADFAIPVFRLNADGRIDDDHSAVNA